MTRPPKADPARPTAPRKARPATAPEAPAPKPGGDRIAKVMARAGVSSRRDAERMIAEGRVTVNGKVIDSPALDVTPRDRITVDGHPLDKPEPPRVWLYHKPEGLVTSARDEQGRATVFDHLPEDLPRVMTIGRLDLNSEGLLLLTNDGELKRRLELPSTGWLRKYRVRVNGRPEDSAFDPLRKGIVAGGETFQPMVVSLDRQQGANAWLTVGIREGKNREIRRAMEAVGLTVNRLIRVSYGPFQLGELKPGEVSEVRPRMLKDQLGLTETPMPLETAKPRPARSTGKGAPAAGEGGRLGPAGKPAGRAAPAARPSAGGTRTATGAPAKPPRSASRGAAGLAASAEAWLDRADAKSATDRRSPKPTPTTGPGAKGGLSRGGARPEAMPDPQPDRPTRAPRPPRPEAGSRPPRPEAGSRPPRPAGGAGKGPAGAGTRRPPTAPKGGGRGR
jgi:23S rRNA pseudouridine2605 synthase